MKILEYKDKRLLGWHKTVDSHPIFDPAYAQENLMSLAQTLSMLFLYFSMVVLLFHFFILNGFLESETLTWLIIESTARKLMLGAADFIFYNKLFSFLYLILFFVSSLLVRLYFDLKIAALHPYSPKLVAKFSYVAEEPYNFFLPIMAARIKKLGKEVKKWQDYTTRYPDLETK